MSRTYNTSRNVIVGLGCYCTNMILAFLNRTLFVYYLGVVYLGLNGLFANIISVLSLAELGIGVAITYSLYKPLSYKDRETIAAYMLFFKKAYTFIGVFIFLAGLLFLPFLDILFKERPAIDHISIIYVLILSNTSVSYFFSYKRILLSADQCEYINNINRTFFILIQTVTQIFVLVVYKDYIIYLLVAIASSLFSNIRISYICAKRYPYISDSARHLTKSELHSLFKYTAAQVSHKVGAVVVSGTSNILTSSMLSNGLQIVGIYSNYLLIINSASSIIQTIFSSTTASIGNLNAEGDMKKSKDVFNKMLFLNMLFYVIPSTLFMCLINDIICLWLGADYVLDKLTVYSIVLYFYIGGMRQTCTTFNTTLGLFWNDRYKPWCEAALNLFVSILLIKRFGFIGVIWGGIISTILSCVWVEPYILYKHGFNMPVRDYFRRYILYFLNFAICAVLSISLSGMIPSGHLMLLLLKLLVVLSIIGIYLFFKYRKENESIYVYSFIKKQLYSLLYKLSNK